MSRQTIFIDGDDKIGSCADFDVELHVVEVVVAVNEVFPIQLTHRARHVWHGLFEVIRIGVSIAVVRVEPAVREQDTALTRREL